MKKIVFFLILLQSSSTLYCQGFTGVWEGKLIVGQNSIDIVFHIMNSDNNSNKVTLDVPIQKAFKIPASEVLVNCDTIVIIFNAIALKYRGILTKQKYISGTWLQSGIPIQLLLKKTREVSAAKKLNRPQTPHPPFLYKSEDIEYDNADKSIHFGATLTIPFSGSINKGSRDVYPVVILITGSGKQDRDETMLEHKPFAVIADFLSRCGIAVMRVDDREIGKSTGHFITSTTIDFASDVEAGIEYLKSRSEIDIENIGLLGHSEGGLIASIVAAKRNDIRFIVLLAAPGIKSTELIEQQSNSLFSAQGVPPKELDEMKHMMHDLVSAIMAAPNLLQAKQQGLTIFKDWIKNESKSTVRRTTGVTDEQSMNNYVSKMVIMLSQPWYSSFMRIDPEVYLSKVKCGVLALNGEKDIQVNASINLDAIDKGLKKGGNKNIEIKQLVGLNHFFQHCKKCTFEEYYDLEETIAPEVLDIIGSWILRNVAY